LKSAARVPIYKLECKVQLLCHHVEHGGFMSMQQLKELFGNQEAILELVQLEGGELGTA
jgi:hypothetical protein